MALCQRKQWDRKECHASATSRMLVVVPSGTYHPDAQALLWLCSQCTHDAYATDPHRVTLLTPPPARTQ